MLYHLIFRWYNYIMKQRYSHLKLNAISLRKRGKMYSEIQKILNEKVPKSTLSLWFKEVKFSNAQNEALKKRIENKLIESRAISLKNKREKKEIYLKEVEKRNIHLKNSIKDKNVAKIAIAMLYLGEGTKRGPCIVFGNSNPEIIGLFMRLLRYCYNINENKLRCTLQCRADQNIKKLEIFWSEITKIPLNLFYKAQIDPRSIGKKSNKSNYKGVCRIDYFSSDVFNEIKKIGEILSAKGL